MSRQNLILNYFIFISFILSNSIVSNFPDHIDRQNTDYKGYYDCFGYNKQKPDSTIVTAEDCFDESPRTKWKCCFFTYKKDETIFNGCMRVRKGDDEDLNDLKYFVSKLSSETTFNCKQSYLEYSYIIFISLLLFFL